MTGMASPHEEKYSRMHLDKVWYVSLERLQKFEESNHCPEYKKSKYVLIYICIQNVFTKNEEVYMPRSIFFLFFDLLEVREENLKSQYLSFAFEASRQKCASPPKPNWIKNNTTHYWNIKYSIGIALSARFESAQCCRVTQPGLLINGSITSIIDQACSESVVKKNKLC